MKKLIILFCGTLALAACGNGLEKKANEKLMVAKAAYEVATMKKLSYKLTVSRFCIPKRSKHVRRDRH